MLSPSIWMVSFFKDELVHIFFFFREVVIFFFREVRPPQNVPFGMWIISSSRQSRPTGWREILLYPELPKLIQLWGLSREQSYYQATCYIRKTYMYGTADISLPNTCSSHPPVNCDLPFQVPDSHPLLLWHKTKLPNCWKASHVFLRFLYVQN